MTPQDQEAVERLTDPTNPVLAVELEPCPFCGGPAMKPIRNNGTDATGCQDTKCAGGDVLSPVGLWNRRAHLSQGWKPDREAVANCIRDRVGGLLESFGVLEPWQPDIIADAILALPTPAPKDEGWRPISEIETTFTANVDVVLRCLVVANVGTGLVVGEAEFYGEDEGWWWAGERGTYHGDRIYPTLYQPLPTAPTQSAGGTER